MASLKRKDGPGSKPAAKPPAGEPPSKRPRSDSVSKSKDKTAGAQKPEAPTSAPVVSKLKEEEPLFPRGGGSVLTPLEHKQIKVQASKDVLFEHESGKASEKGDRSAKKLRTKKSRTQLKELTKNSDAVKVESLNFKRLVKGSLVLGQIAAIHPLDLEVSLPNNLTGHVKATAISTQLTQKLQEAMDVDEEEDEDGDNDIDLGSLFHVGQYVRAYVVSTMEEPSAAGGKGKRRIELSLQPENANTGLSSEDVVENCTVAGSISSAEDHGYVVDLGIQGLRGFLPKKEVDPSIPATQLEPGCVHLMFVTSANGKIAQVSTLNKKLGNLQLFPGTAKTINTFLPGTAADVLISDVSGRGLVGKVMGSLDVTADLVHSGLGPHAINLEKKYKVGSKVKARVICNFPTSNELKLGISLLDHIASLQPKRATVDGNDTEPLAALPHSTIVERCTVSKVEPGIGLFVDMGIEGVPGFVHISRVKDGKVDALYESSGPYKIGSVHRGRIVGYGPMDGLYHVSFEKSVLERKYLRVEDVPVGEVVTVTIEKLVVKEDGLAGVIVQLADGITGFVPEMHLADVRLQHPEKKFREGLKVKARVLTVDPVKKQLRLTFKKTIVNSEAMPIKHYTEASVGQQVQGTIIKIKPFGAFVQFYGSLRGFLPIHEMSESFIRDPNEHFRVGQVVNVHVLRTDSEKQRLVVSCKDPSAFGVEKQLALRKLQVGDLVSGSVTEKTEDNVFLELKDSLLKAVLRAHHLTDKSPSKNQSALKKIRVGQVLEDMVVLEKNEGRHSIVLSLKPSLVKAAQTGQFLSNVADAKVGALAQGFVRNITANAAFVQFGGNLTALLPKSLMSPTMQTQENFGLRLHQSIQVKVHSVDDKRLVVAMPDAQPPAKEAKPRHEAKPITNPIDPSISSTDDITVGKVTKARIASIKKTQLNVSLGDNIQGRVDVSEVFDAWDEIENPKDPLSKFSQNQIIDVRVIGVHDARNYRFLPFSHRTANSVLELTAKPSSLRAKEEYKPLALADVEPGSNWLAFVNNMEDDRLWVNLSPMVRGRIRSREVSDDSSLAKDLRHNFPVGSALRARVLAVDAENGKLDLTARSARPNEHMTWEEVSKDTVMHARVTKVTDRQVFIQISDTVSGPVNLIDLSDDYDQANPLKYSKNDIVRVAVVDVDKSNKKLRLSTRDSRVLNSALPVKDREITSVSQVEQGSIVRGFVKNVSDKGLFVNLGGDVTALVRISDLSDAYLKEWKEHFQVGQLVKGRVLAVDQAVGQIRMSLKASAVDENYKPPPGYGDFKEGQVVTGKVRKVADFGAFILIENSANVSGLCHRTEMADKPVKDATKLYKEGDIVKAIILSIDSDKRKISLGLKPSYFDNADSDDDMDDDDDSDGSGALISPESDDEDEDGDSQDEETDDADSVVLFTGTGGASSSDVDGDDDDNDDVSMSGAQTGSAALPGLDAGGFDWSGANLDAADNGSDAGEEDQATRRRKTKRKKTEIEMDRTADLDANGPQTAGDFERLLLGQPNSSALWIGYMAFHMQVSELDKAREIAERAINTINVREETEKLNVWIAYLNLEVAYGTEESLNEVFKRACQYNDDLEVHERLASICIQSGKHDKADELFQAMVKKFGSKSPKVWLNYAHFLYTSVKSPERGRALLPRAMQSLGSHAHLELASRFAGLEFRCDTGDAERGRTVFEGLLATYPKRFDLRNQLLDLEMAAANSSAGDKCAAVREVFERGAKAAGLRPNQAKKWFQRWAKWEEEHGDAKSRERVSARAQEWARLAAARKAEKATDQGEGGGDESE